MSALGASPSVRTTQSRECFPASAFPRTLTLAVSSETVAVQRCAASRSLSLECRVALSCRPCCASVRGDHESRRLRRRGACGGGLSGGGSDALLLQQVRRPLQGVLQPAQGAGGVDCHYEDAPSRAADHRLSTRLLHRAYPQVPGVRQVCAHEPLGGAGALGSHRPDALPHLPVRAAAQGDAALDQVRGCARGPADVPRECGRIPTRTHGEQQPGPRPRRADVSR
mmetsp:Transcript_15280/g.45315  ORF Transcript_15280/g.45315 Transcript_15280/m.45315 type:complete len:225 (+) Transcript_15280:644-1318(+)